MTNDREPKTAETPRQHAAQGNRVAATEAMRSAVEQLTELLGRQPESVSSLKPTEEGWQARVEVVEVERIPETTSVMASYDVVLDPAGQLLAYERGRRYTRAQTDRDDR
ncbi:gas vesicle protein [Streptomyces sp. SCA3-4]|uniref:gas vesicle protein GvpO n=1 Tax=Streptomyces sichuanensis TaxID=2871810 RepID=UPI001CE36E1D|nr:gas vesicle protein [Streptomyces sichuanensis]MCA6093253.1 gas vesicle protein [Streptomyces sichuanensis]